jgi:hypothetical protein
MPTDRTHLVTTLRTLAAACGELGSRLYAELLADLATDVESGGISARVLAGHEDDPASAVVGLRLLGAVHRLVLTGQASALAVHYPSVGGQYIDHAAAWRDLAATLETHDEFVRSLLSRAPQTNEVGRAAALVGGLLFAVDRFGLPVRLYEIGASAGLNLRADWYRYIFDSGAWGDPESPVVLDPAWLGVVPPWHHSVEVIERVGCDVAPIDPTTSEGQLTLLSYVWPDHIERFVRLRAALAVATRVPVQLLKASAGEFVSGLRLQPGTTTVLWHSVVLQYLHAEERSQLSAHLDRLHSSATPEAAFVQLSFEPQHSPGATPDFFVTMHASPNGAERILGTAPGHGVPVHWLPAGQQPSVAD